MGGGLRALEDISTKHVNSFLDVFPISPQSPYYKYILPCEFTNEYINAKILMYVFPLSTSDS